MGLLRLQQQLMTLESAVGQTDALKQLLLNFRYTHTSVAGSSLRALMPVVLRRVFHLVEQVTPSVILASQIPNTLQKQAVEVAVCAAALGILVRSASNVLDKQGCVFWPSPVHRPKGKKTWLIPSLAKTKTTSLLPKTAWVNFVPLTYESCALLDRCDLHLARLLGANEVDTSNSTVCRTSSSCELSSLEVVRSEENWQWAKHVINQLGQLVDNYMQSTLASYPLVMKRLPVFFIEPCDGGEELATTNLFILLAAMQFTAADEGKQNSKQALLREPSSDHPMKLPLVNLIVMFSTKFGGYLEEHADVVSARRSTQMGRCLKFASLAKLYLLCPWFSSPTVNTKTKKMLGFQNIHLFYLEHYNLATVVHGNVSKMELSEQWQCSNFRQASHFFIYCLNGGLLPAALRSERHMAASSSSAAAPIHQHSAAPARLRSGTVVDEEITLVLEGYEQYSLVDSIVGKRRRLG